MATEKSAVELVTDLIDYGLDDPGVEVEINGQPHARIGGKVVPICTVCRGPLEGAPGPECDETGCPERDGSSCDSIEETF